MKLGYPLMVYSYSSRAAEDVGEQYRSTRDDNPLPLLSLYDVHHHFKTTDLRSASSDGRFLDSGNYEVSVTPETWMPVGPPGDHPWTPELYVATARATVNAGDWLVSFDDPSRPLAEQVRLGLTLFEAAAGEGIRRDLLIHPNGASPGDVAELVMREAASVDALGLTEKDIGLPWYIGAAFLKELRRHLKALRRYLPIHLFGCLDPRTIPLLCFAGADIFDGLGWTRYYFRDGHAYYAREFEHDAPPEALLSWESITRALARHNIVELQRMRANLRYTVLTGDTSIFEEPLRTLHEVCGGL